jgi:hypothetical protein
VEFMMSRLYNTKAPKIPAPYSLELSLFTCAL